MTDFRRVTDRLSVSPQISLADVAEAARQGFKTLINNRPDGEEPGQPTSREMEAAAAKAGMAYMYVPVRGAALPEQVELTRHIFESTDKPVLAFCRSGTRSITTWARAQVATGARSKPELVEMGRAAGYDLSAALP